MAAPDLMMVEWKPSRYYFSLCTGYTLPLTVNTEACPQG